MTKRNFTPIHFLSGVERIKAETQRLKEQKKEEKIQEKLKISLQKSLEKQKITQQKEIAKKIKEQEKEEKRLEKTKINQQKEWLKVKEAQQKEVEIKNAKNKTTKAELMRIELVSLLKNIKTSNIEYELGTQNKESIIKYFSFVLNKSNFPEGFNIDFDTDFFEETNTFVIDYQLFNIDKIPLLKEMKYVVSKRDYKSQSQTN